MPLLAILSDTHDQIARLNAAVGYANEACADVMVHCGDLISAFMLDRLAAFLGPVHLIYGNNTGDTHIIIPRCFTRFPEITHHGVIGSFCEDGVAVGITHFPEEAHKLAENGLYDIVCYGHTHQFTVETIGRTVLINPGSMLGENDDAGFVLYDTTKKTIQRICIGDCMFDTPVAVRAGETTSLDNR